MEQIIHKKKASEYIHNLLLLAVEIFQIKQ